MFRLMYGFYAGLYKGGAKENVQIIIKKLLYINRLQLN